MTRRWRYRSHVLSIGGVVLAASALGVLPSTAATTTCATVSIAKINKALGIDAAHVSAVRPAKNPTALICSYYGNSGRAANEVTINYVPATAASFAALKASNARSHRVRTISGIGTSAYSFAIGTEGYLYVLKGKEQVQIFAIASLPKLEALGRALPPLS
jgi:hypothetical protein